MEIGVNPGEVPLRLPVVVQNFAAGVLTLKVSQSVGWVEWETLTGHESQLRLPASRSGAMESISGRISWLKQAGPEGVSVFLGMELAKPTPEVQKLLEDEILHTPKDIKDLWHQWDRVQVKNRRSGIRALVLLGFGAALAAAGGGLLAFPQTVPEIYGYATLATGGFMVLIAGIWLWRRRRV
ncbi:MAG: hypothetical protein QME75_08085 [Deltaproteobacteria bacterium]|nr:hypothetical protein [Deltaproteobacteria bacterium]